MQVNKGADLQTSFTAVQRIESRLQYAFLWLKAVQRDAERVTSTELKILTNELESTSWWNLLYPDPELQLVYLKKTYALVSQVR